MVAAVCTWHEGHESSAKEIIGRLRRGEEVIVAAPALIEAYSVLTRLPSPHRLSPEDALALLAANFISGGKVISLSTARYVNLLRRAPSLGISGGRVYDAVIAQCAIEGKAETLLTLNEEHFRDWASDRLKIVVPGGPGILHR